MAVTILKGTIVAAPALGKLEITEMWIRDRNGCGQR